MLLISVIFGQSVAMATASVSMEEVIAPRSTSSQEGRALWTDNIRACLHALAWWNSRN